jgi:hypothetical protein
MPVTPPGNSIGGVPGFHGADPMMPERGPVALADSILALPGLGAMAEEVKTL